MQTHGGTKHNTLLKNYFNNLHKFNGSNRDQKGIFFELLKHVAVIL